MIEESTSIFDDIVTPTPIASEQFREREIELWEQLLQLQRRLRAEGKSQVIIDFAGVHGAGKHSVVNLLNKWMDPRWIVTRAHGAPSDVATLRPEYWRLWRDPARLR